MRDIIVIAHNIRSTHNVGALFRTCEGLGVTKIILSGYTPYPRIPHDDRLPHIANKIHAQIEKTALGTIKTLPYQLAEHPPIDDLKSQSYRIIALEQNERSTMLPDYNPPMKIALLLGEEVNGIEESLLKQCEDIIEIPMYGVKESFNVSVAAGMALYGLLHAP